jgi:protein neuralized
MGTSSSKCSSDDEYADSLTSFSYDSMQYADNTSDERPLAFHDVCGTNIKLNPDKTIARRIQGFCCGLAFTNRSVKADERIHIRFKTITANWNGFLRIGFTRVNPNANVVELESVKYSCPDLTNKKGYWAHGFNSTVAENDIMCFYYNKNGAIVCCVNNGQESVLFDGVRLKPNERLWALFDIYGNTVSIELLSESVIIFDWTKLMMILTEK